jgi:hypothetical protein
MSDVNHQRSHARFHPKRKSKLPTRLACGNAPTSSGVRELSKDLEALQELLAFLYAECCTRNRVVKLEKIK